MAQQTINVGTAPNDGTGTPLRTAFQYTNSNFTELYTATGPSGNNINVPGAATISGDLTVDTSTLYVSSSADKVGIGTTSLSNEKLTVAGNISANAWLGRSNIAAPTGDCSIFRSADNTLGFGIASSTAMTLNSTGLGVGASPQAKLHVSNGATIDSGLFTGLMIGSPAAGSARSASIIKDTSTPYNLIIRTQDFTGGTTGSFIVRNGSTDQFQIDSSGNVGIGVTPSAWGGAYVKALQMNGGGSLVNNQSNDLHLGNNCYHNGTNWVYVSTNTASRYEQFNGGHYWLSAPSGTAGNAITGANEFVAKMQIDSSGNFIILPTNTPPTLSTNGQISINATSNTNLRFRYRGSDGVTRTADITLA